MFLSLSNGEALSAQKLKDYERELSTIFSNSKNYSVTISSSVIPPFRNNYYVPQKEKKYESAIGSGFIFDNQGHIVTTSAVIGRGTLFKITFADGTTRFADLIGTDPMYGISVLEVNSLPFPPPVFANSDNLIPGHWVGLIGNSFGIFPSFSFGIASGRNDEEQILVTADISPGGAGGMAVNSDGDVVGMVAFKLTETTGINSIQLNDKNGKGKNPLVLSDADIDLPVGGYSLVIPSNIIQRIATELISGPLSQGGFLGVVPEDLDLDWAKKVFNINFGVYIPDVQTQSPAYLAGIREGDILMKFNWHKIVSSVQLRKLIYNSNPGDDVDIAIMRGGRIRNFKAVIGNFQPDAANRSSKKYDSKISNPHKSSKSKLIP